MWKILKWVNNNNENDVLIIYFTQYIFIIIVFMCQQDTISSFTWKLNNFSRNPLVDENELILNDMIQQ